MIQMKFYTAIRVVLKIRELFLEYEKGQRIDDIIKIADLEVHGGVQNDYGQITTLKKQITQSLAEIYAGVEEVGPAISVCPQIVTTVSSLMANEVLNNLWLNPQLLNTMLVVELSDYSIFKVPLAK